MYRFLLKPKWIAFHLLCALTIAGMVWLSFWQIRRLHQHDDFKAEVQRRTELAIAPLEQLAEGGPLNPQATEWRRVSVSGTWVASPTFEVVNVSQTGESGHDAVAGLQLADGSILVVNRGFAAGATALPSLPTGTVQLTGRLRTSQTAGALQGTDNGAQALTQIRRVDLTALAPQFTGRTVQPVISEFRDKGILVGRPFPPMINHLRVSVGTPEDMDKFVRGETAKLKQLIKAGLLRPE